MWNIEKVEDDIFNTKDRGTVREISLLRRDIISYRRIIWPMRAVIASLERRTKIFNSEEMEDMKVFWDDAVDHIDKIWDNLDACKEIIEGLKDTNDSLYTHRMNEVMRVLTIIATIMMPLTLVASLYGMNISLPGESSDFSFIIILVIMLIASIGMLLYFRRRSWI